MPFTLFLNWFKPSMGVTLTQQLPAGGVVATCTSSPGLLTIGVPPPCTVPIELQGTAQGGAVGVTIGDCPEVTVQTVPGQSVEDVAANLAHAITQDPCQGAQVVDGVTADASGSLVEVSLFRLDRTDSPPRRRLTRLPGRARSACYLIGHTHGPFEQNQPPLLR